MRRFDIVIFSIVAAALVAAFVTGPEHSPEIMRSLSTVKSIDAAAFAGRV